MPTKYLGVPTRVALADPHGSVFAELWRTGRRDLRSAGARIEGIGRGRVEPPFIPGVIDEVLTVTDGESIAAMRLRGPLPTTPPRGCANRPWTTTAPGRPSTPYVDAPPSGADAELVRRQVRRWLSRRRGSGRLITDLEAALPAGR